MLYSLGAWGMRIDDNIVSGDIEPSLGSRGAVDGIWVASRSFSPAATRRRQEGFLVAPKGGLE